MAGYAYRDAQAPAVILPVEQARRRNAELRRELAALLAEQAGLAPKVEAMRAEVSAARKKLSRQIRDLETIRVQARNLEAVTVRATATEPLYGGTVGLKAATEEIRAHDKVQPILHPDEGGRCGTRRKYGNGCRCDSCLGWRERKPARELVLKEQRVARRVAEALQGVAA